uniref:Uncharacterized protein n=1 Tax=Lotharella globosa TaxID=91324 RepID=A0A7S3ZAW0_9EUKA|mmetsp:Transcript_39108/g.75061  ORF Transcript_39108/g.75061 Transcript_39108/m.75061 type:complete len:325 (+) Transcript_39108:53-1027(+)
MILLTVAEIIFSESINSLPPILVCCAVHFAASGSLILALNLAFLFYGFAHLAAFLKSKKPIGEYFSFSGRNYHIIHFSENYEGAQIVLRSLINAMVIVSIRPSHPPAQSLVSTLARAGFCRTIPTNLRLFSKLAFRHDLRRRPILKSSKILWTFPCPIFNSSMVMGYICARVSKRAISTFEARGTDFVNDAEKRRYALISFVSFQMLCYACIPAFSAPETYSAPANDFMRPDAFSLPSGRDTKLPNELCMSVMERKLSDESFQGIINWYTGWNFGLYEAKMLYEYLSKASPWVLANVTTCDFAEPLVQDIATSWGSFMGNSSIS